MSANTSIKVDVERIGTARRIEYARPGKRARFVHDFRANVPVYRTADGRHLIIGGKLKVTRKEIRG